MIRLLVAELEPGEDPETQMLARALRDNGVEVVYARAATVQQIAQAAIQEDVRAVGLVVRTDEHRRIAAALARETVVFATAEGDEPELRQSGQGGFPFPGSGTGRELGGCADCRSQAVTDLTSTEGPARRAGR